MSGGPFGEGKEVGLRFIPAISVPIIDHYEGLNVQKERQVTALVPMKGYSKRVPSKNLHFLGNRPPFRWSILSRVIASVTLIRRQFA